MHETRAIQWQIIMHYTQLNWIIYIYAVDAPAYKAHITNKEKLLELNITYYDFIKQVKFDLY